MTADELRRLLAEATPGPWRQTGTKARPHWYVTSDIALVHGNLPPTREDYAPETIQRWIADAALIVAAVNVLPAHLDVIKAARDELACQDREFGTPSDGLDRCEHAAALRAALARLDAAE